MPTLPTPRRWAFVDEPGPLAPVNLSHIDTWIFDLDNTLYRAEQGFWDDIGEKMTGFISRHLAMSTEDALELQERYFHSYGATLSGLIDIHGMDPAPFLDYVHDVDLSVLTPEPALRDAIEALPGRKLVFTNGSRGHIKNVTEHLGLAGLFDGGFAIEDAHYRPKPGRSAYETFNDVFDVDPQRSIFFEDTLRNLDVPKQMGMATVLVTDDARGTGDLWVDVDGQARRATYVDAVTDHLSAWLRDNAPRS